MDKETQRCGQDVKPGLPGILEKNIYSFIRKWVSHDTDTPWLCLTPKLFAGNQPTLPLCKADNYILLERIIIFLLSLTEINLIN